LVVKNYAVQNRSNVVMTVCDCWVTLCWSFQLLEVAYIASIIHFYFCLCFAWRRLIAIITTLCYCIVDSFSLGRERSRARVFTARHQPFSDDCHRLPDGWQLLHSPG